MPSVGRVGEGGGAFTLLKWAAGVAALGALVLLLLSLALNRGGEEVILDRLVGSTRRDVVRVLGAPDRTFLSPKAPGFPMEGYRRPKTLDFAACDAYPSRYGLNYVFYNEEGRMFYWEHVGG